MRDDDWSFGDVLQLPSGVTVMVLGISRGAVCEDGYVAPPGTWIGLVLDAPPDESQAWPPERTCAMIEGDFPEMWSKVE